MIKSTNEIRKLLKLQRDILHRNILILVMSKYQQFMHPFSNIIFYFAEHNLRAFISSQDNYKTQRLLIFPNINGLQTLSLSSVCV